jgi:signal transduction histidine kinase
VTLDALFDAAWNRRDRTALPALQDWLDESVVDHDPDAVARACLGTARLLLLDREYGVAGELVDRGIAAGPRDELTRLRLLNLRAYCFLELGSIAEAVEPLLVVERTAGEHVAEGRQAQINLALALLDLGDVAGAREGFERLATAPGARTWDVAFARYGQGRCLAREGRFDDVERLVTALRALRVEDRRLLAHEDLLTAMVADGRGRWAEVHPSALRAQLALGDDAGGGGGGGGGGGAGVPGAAVAGPPVRGPAGRRPAARRRGPAARAAGPTPGPVLREKALVEGALGDAGAAQLAWQAAFDSLEAAEPGTGRALRASSERARADVARVRELELSAAHEALQRAYRTVEERVAERTRDLQVEVGERRAAEARALSASRAKSEFLAGMSHELRTPLNAILGYTELLLDDATDPARKDLAAIHGSARHLLSLVDDLLDLARVEAGRLPVHPVDVDVPALLAEVGGRLAPGVAAAGSALEVRVDPSVGRFRTDPTRLAQVVQNLVSNAARHTPGGTVRVDVAARGDVLSIDVVDTGTGIPRALLARVFEPFVQGEGGGRAGLGLALVRHLAEALRGTVSLESEEGRGTRAVVNLHACPPASRPPAPG